MERADYLERMQEHLQEAVRLRSAARSATLARQRDALRRWQAARLEQTYADLRAQPRYALAAEFFLADIYGTGDLARRDAQLTRAIPSMIKLLPARALEPLALAIEVDALSERLDRSVAERLFGRSGSTTIDHKLYAAAYRATATEAERARQIGLIVRVGEELERIAGSSLISTTISLMEGPARQAGFDELQSFLDRGLKAFRKMKGAREFLDVVRSRELSISAHLFGGQDDPFHAPLPAPSGPRKP